MTPSHIRKADKLHRSYVAMETIRQGYSLFQYDTELLKLARRSPAISADSSPTRP